MEPKALVSVVRTLPHCGHAGCGGALPMSATRTVCSRASPIGGAMP
jgi:hypothetical protein